MSERFDILVAGGGIAGLATAMHLARKGGRRIVVLDREDHPGFYASGHNAAIARQLTGRAEHTALTVEGRAALAAAGLLDATGGRLLALDASALAPLAVEADTCGVDVEPGNGSGVPGLKATAHLRIPSDGIIDVHGLLGLCAREARAAGATVRFGCGIAGIAQVGDGFRVESTAGVLEADVLVNAAGAWAGHLGRMAGGLGIPFQPLRRHLAWSDGTWPFDSREWAWWVDRPLYLRPESGGVLMCPCDEVAVEPPEAGRQPDADPDVIAGMQADVHNLAPCLEDHGIARAWSGLRTFAPDRRFVIGWDPVNPRLFWVAGLGGHGMTSGLAVGRLAASLIELGALPRHPLSPARFG